MDRTSAFDHFHRELPDWAWRVGPMAELELKQDDIPLAQEAKPARRLRRSTIVRGLTLTAIVVISGFLVVQGLNLWQEWNMLQQQLSAAEEHAFVGYVEISPRLTTAKSPAEWYRDEGKESLLWSRWENNVGHSWFRFETGDIDKAQLVRPSTAIFSRPIDSPIIETDGGVLWKRIPGRARVVAHTIGSVNCVYPVDVLSKVQVINDVVDDRPLVIAINLMAPPEHACSIFEANLDGRRITMGVSGYFRDRHPLLFDRGTESLWVEEGDALKSLGGKWKGKQLTRVAQPVPVTWVSWLAKHKGGRLVVGADRTQAVPTE
jgi:hypothetical protein